MYSKTTIPAQIEADNSKSLLPESVQHIRALSNFAVDDSDLNYNQLFSKIFFRKYDI